MSAIRVVIAQHRNDIDMALINQIRRQEPCIEFLAISTNPDLIIDQLALGSVVEVAVIDAQLMADGSSLHQYIGMQENPIPVILVDESLENPRDHNTLPPGIFMAIPKPPSTIIPDQESLLQKSILLAGNSYRHSKGQESCCTKHCEPAAPQGSNRAVQPDSQLLAPTLKQNKHSVQQLLPQRKMPTNLNQILDGNGYSPRLPSLLPRFGKNKKYNLLAIGASTGGPEALKVLLQDLPPSFPVPILLVQHISANFIHSFTESVDHYSKMPVETAVNSGLCRAGTIYMVPSKIHLGIQANSIAKHVVLKLSTSPPTQNSHIPSVGYLFDSIAQSALASSTVAIIMSGMGEDGAAEIGRIKQAGGVALAQDESSSIVFGMPKLAIQLGSVHREVPLHLMPALIRHLFRVA